MAIYTTTAQITARVATEPVTSEVVEYFDLRVAVEKDGEEIGQIARRISTGSSNAEIREFLLGEIRRIIEEDLVKTSQANLDDRAMAIENAINVWEKTI